MKLQLKYLSILLLSILSMGSMKSQGSQEEVQTITIDFSMFEPQNIVVTGGKRKVKIVNIPKEFRFSLEVKAGRKQYKELSIDGDVLLKKEKVEIEIPEIFDFDLFDTYIIVLNAFDEDGKKIKKYCREYSLGVSRGWGWSSMFGFNAVFLTNNDTYRTIESGTQFKIVEDGGQEMWNYIPSVMFNFSNQDKKWPVGIVGGIGSDLKSVSIFGGGSLTIGQNIMFSAGLAFHNQLRLDSKYNSNQLVDEELGREDLHSVYYRFNPFVSISFRLNQSPFK